MSRDEYIAQLSKLADQKISDLQSQLTYERQRREAAEALAKQISLDWFKAITELNELKNQQPRP